MSRKVFDILASSAGVVVVVVLVIAGGLLTWGHSFVNSNVHSQLAQQQIYFPPKAAFEHPKAGTERVVGVAYKNLPNDPVGLQVRRTAVADG